MKWNKIKIFRLMMITVAIAILSAPIQVQAKSAKKSALDAYKRMLSFPDIYLKDLLDLDEEDTYTRSVDFSLGYVDNNKTPELFVRTKVNGYYYSEAIYTWKSGRVKQVDAFIADDVPGFKGYYKKTGIFVMSALTDEGMYEEICRLKSGKLRFIAEGRGKTRNLPADYRIKKKKVSKQAYKNYKKKVSKRKKLTKLSWKSNTPSNRNIVLGR